MNVLALEVLRAAVPNVLDLAAVGPQDPVRTIAPRGVVVHSPGRTWAASIRKSAGNVDLETVDRAAAAAFDLRQYRPGYLVGQSGIVCRLEADNHSASHAGVLSAAHYPMSWWLRQPYLSGWQDWARPLGRTPADEFIRHRREPEVVYDWWIARYGRGRSPIETFPWGRYPNRAIGIDLFPDSDGNFSAPQLGALAILIRLLSDVFGFLLDDRCVTTHSCAAPLERGTIWKSERAIGIPWDPGGNFDLTAVLAAARAATEPV